jgi:hypothetical protein
MSFKGFDKKIENQNKLKKINQIRKNLEDTKALKQKAISFGKDISNNWMKQSQEIRLQSEKQYGNILIESRLLMVTAIADLLTFKAGVPGNTNEQLGNILQLVTIFWQGQFYTEKVISEGQYVQASTAIKQEIEIIARITEIKKGVAQDGKTPNVKYAPPMFNIHYGDMNNIAHISKPSVLDVLASVDEGTFRGVSITPIFNPGIAKTFYEIHLIIFYNIIVESIELFQELYTDDLELVLPAYEILKIVVDYLQKAGILKEN